MNQKSDGLLFKLSLLSISTVLMLAASIAPALPLMTQHYANQSQSSVELLLTVPNFGIILALFVSPICVKFLGKKVTVLIGLSLALLTGAIPLFMDSFQLVFVSRFLFGFGVGLFNSLAVSLLADFYTGDELAGMMGFQTVASAIGAATASFAVSFLVTKGWQASFAIYLLIIPVLVLFALFVPIKENKQVEEATIVKEKQTVNSSVLVLTGLIFALFAFYMVIPIKLPEFVMTKELGSMSSVSIITAISTLVGIPIGILYGKLNKLFKENLLLIGLSIITLGFTTITFSNSLLLVTIGVLLAGIGFGITIPFIYTKVAMVAPKNSVNLAYTFILIATNIGVFSSPLIINSLGKLFNMQRVESSMLLAVFGFAFLLIIAFISRLKTKNTTHSVDAKGEI